jgi:hypothetical protein
LAARESSVLFWSLVLLGIALSLLIVPGVFIIDEPNYLATVVGVREGSWRVPSTAGLPPSRELTAFDPENQSRTVTSTPVTSLAPPLYALLALPFSWFGWTSLFLLSVLAFVVTAWCVYALVREHGGSMPGAVIATVLFTLGGFSIEYALGMWPHMLSISLTTSALLWTTRSWHRPMPAAVIAGLLAATAVGVREQNIVIAGGLGASMLMFARPRWRAMTFYAAGLALPLLLISAINLERLGSFHPLPKLGSYASETRSAAEPAAAPVGGPAAVLWAKVVDFRGHPPFTDPLKERLFRNDPATGVPIVGGGVVKKALLQSAPWIALALVMLLAGWRSNAGAAALPAPLLGTSLWIVVPVFGVIAAAGFGRSDGLAYNQRYLLELVPVFAVVAGLASDRRTALAPFFAGAVVSAAGAVALLAMTDVPERYRLIALVPLVIAALCVLAGLLRPRRISEVLLPAVIGIALGWSVLIHLTDDVRASRERRTAHDDVLRAIDPHIPEGAALFTYWGGRDALGPLMLTKDALLIDAWADQGADAVRLRNALHARGQRVFVRVDGFPLPLLSELSQGCDTLRLRDAFPQLIEILPPS